jgi:general secretion pathway protein D
MSNPANPEAKEARTFEGTDGFMGGVAPAVGRAAAPGATNAADGVTLNFAGATIPEAAKTVLGDTLGLNYSVSDSLKGSITVRTPKPIARKDLLTTFETLLRAEGAVIQVENGIHRVVPSDAASGAPLRRSGSSGGGGISSDAIALRHVTPDDMQRLIQGMAPQGAKLTGDASRNLLMVSGTSSEIVSVREMVAIFDVDWMRGMSFGLFPVESGDPEAIAQELDTIFANDRSSPTKGIVRFVPNRRLKSVLVVTSRREYLDKAEKWLKRIDLVGQESEKQVNVYRVQNRPAAELAVLLQKVYGQQRDRGGAGRTGLPPGTPAATLSSDALAPVVAVPVDGRTSGAAPNGPRPLATPTPTAFALPGQAVPAVPAAPAPAAAIVDPQIVAASAPSGVVMDDRTSGIEITSDDTNNALIITASSREYKRIRNILSRIDVAPPQVLLEATIAEVTLNDRLAQGVRWFFEKKSSQFTLTDSVVGAIAPKVPGFSYFLNTSNIQVALSALSDITDVNIVSSPSMVVLDNKLAQLQIGDEVPIATQSAVSVLAPGSPIVNSVAFRSTGVILNITPHIGDNGRIMLDIEQEVSDVVPTTSSTIDSPTIQQRRIKTKVAVGSGEVIVLAGFIQDRARKSRQQVPLLGNIPVLGNLFKDKTDEIRRTELMIAITPHIVQDAQQLRAIASEFRDRMNFTTRPQRTAPPDRREQIDRTLVR